MADLSAGIVQGRIRITDVGHNPLSTKITIAANRTADAWHVSYSCEPPPRCAGGVDNAAREYDLSPAATAEAERILAALREGKEPDGLQPRPEVMGGNLLVSIDYAGFKREYRREVAWGKTLGRLEELLSPP